MMAAQDIAATANAASHEQEWKYAEKALTWYGWGSPVGTGMFLVGLGCFAVLLRIAVLGL